MSLSIMSMGEGYVPAYQLSGTPWVTSSQLNLGQITEVSFSHVTRFFTLKNTAATGSVIAFGFTRNGLLPANANYFTLSGSETFSAELKTDRIFLSGVTGNSSYNLIAGLTGILPLKFLPITSSNGFMGVG